MMTNFGLIVLTAGLIAAILIARRLMRKHPADVQLNDLPEVERLAAEKKGQRHVIYLLVALTITAIGGFILGWRANSSKSEVEPGTLLTIVATRPITDTDKWKFWATDEKWQDYWILSDELENRKVKPGDRIVRLAGKDLYTKVQLDSTSPVPAPAPISTPLPTPVSTTKVTRPASGSSVTSASK